MSALPPKDGVIGLSPTRGRALASFRRAKRTPTVGIARTLRRLVNLREPSNGRWTAEKIAPQNERLIELEEAIAELRTKLIPPSALKHQRLSPNEFELTTASG